MRAENEQLRTELTALLTTLETQNSKNLELKKIVDATQTENHRAVNQVVALKDEMQRQKAHLLRYQSEKEEALQATRQQLDTLQLEMPNIQQQRAKLEVVIERDNKEIEDIHDTMNELQSTLKQFVREWGAEGQVCPNGS